MRTGTAPSASIKRETIRMTVAYPLRGPAKCRIPLMALHVHTSCRQRKLMEIIEELDVVRKWLRNLEEELVRTATDNIQLAMSN